LKKEKLFDYTRVRIGGHENKKGNILLIHGSWANFHHFNDCASTLNDAGYTTHQIELPFHKQGLKEDLKGVSLMDYVEVVTQYITEEIGGPCAIIGHSMGGLLAQKAAELCPEIVEKIALIASAPPRWIPLLNPKMTWEILTNKHYRKPMFSGGTLTVLEEEQKKFLFNNFSDEKEKRFWMGKLLPESGKALLEMSTVSIPVGKINAKVCIIASKEDALVPYWTSEWMCRKYGCDIFYPMIGGHYFFLDPAHKKEVQGVILRFLAK
jgi:pimeloyl-ACP methyl ester carboxylesterase